MRKTFLFITAILLFAGCAKEQLVDERSYSGPVTVVSATFESLGDDATKAAVTDGGTFTWQNGDKAAFTANAGSEYLTGTNDQEGTTANFTIIGEYSAFTSNSFAFYPSDLTTDQSTSSLSVNVPTIREWKEEQTNVAMYGTKVNGDSKFNFTHMGGLVRVKINNVPTNARSFVFKTPGYKINGNFSVEAEESNYKVIKTASSQNKSEETYTLTWETAPEKENTMCFYIPLPTGKYENGFAFSLLNEKSDTLISKSAPQSDSISRKDLILMPSITLMGGEIEPAARAAVVANIPAGYYGDFLLPQSENVLLKIDATGEDHNINLKYTEGTVPTNLEIQVEVNNVEESNNFDACLSGNLPYTHVEFTQGLINETKLITSASTFAVKNPATVNTLVVMGGNVVLKGATVGKIAVDAGAFADGETKAPVQIVMVKDGEYVPVVTNGIAAAANVIVAPEEQDIEVTVTPENNAKVATEGAGTVKDGNNNDQPIITKAAAKIGDAHYITLADAVKAAPSNAGESRTTITLLENVTEGEGIFLAADAGKNIVIDLNKKTYTAKEPAVGSKGYETQAFHLEKGNTVEIKNGTINCHAENKDKKWTSIDTDKGIAMIIQDYANLTLDSLTIDGTNIAHNGNQVRYMVSSNYGNVNITGSTSIKAPEGDIAFDVYDKKTDEYPGVPTVTVNTTGTIEGQVEVTGGNLVVEAGTFKTTVARGVATSPTLLVKSGTVTVSDGTFDSANDVAVRAEGGTVTLNNGEFTGVEGAVCFPRTGATINIVDGTYTASDNAVLIGQGSNKTGESNTVNVSGGEFIGKISSEGYIACGIYSAWNDKITVTDGEFTITGGAGVVARAGIVTIEGGVFNCTGTATGKVGDKNVDIPCEPLYFDDSDPKYPGYDANTSKIIATGGSFSNEPAAKYIDPAHTVVKEDNIYKVVERTGVAQIGNVQYNSLAAAIEAVKDNETIKLLADVTDGKGIIVPESKNFTVDFGTHTYTCASDPAGSDGTKNQVFQLLKNSTITFKNGTINVAESAKSNFRFIIQNYANLTLEDMTLDGTNLAVSSSKVNYTVSNNNGNVAFTGKTNIKAAASNGIAFDVCKYANYNAPTVTWNSTGTVDGTIELSGGTFKLGHDLAVKQPIKVIAPANLELTDYTLSADSGFTRESAGVIIVNRKGHLTVKGNANGTIQANQVYAAVLMTEKNVDTEDITNAAELTVESGTLIGKYYGICGNGSDGRENTKINIKGGTISGTDNQKGNQGIFHPQDGTLTISGGKISGYDSAVEVRSGTVNISGGELTSTATTYQCKANNSGSTIVGAALAIAQHNTKKSINVTISNGSFDGLRAVALEDPQGNKDSTNVKVSISDGTYTASEYAVFNNYAGTTINISGGTFKSTGTDGIAVYARLGSVDIKKGTFENTSKDEATLHVGCKYAAENNITPKLTISGENTEVTNKTEENYSYKDGWKALTVNMANELTYSAVEISGGTFHGQSPEKDDSWNSDSDTNKYFLKTGFKAIESETGTNVWTVSANQN